MSRSATFVRVTAPARLHLGFLDPGATLGRRFGSIGLAIDGIATRVVAEPHTAFALEGLVDERVRALVEQIMARYDISRKLRITLEERITEHAGLGSGTQLALALGTALTQWAGTVAATPDLGRLLRRGKRSGTGLGLFQQGGLIIDGGHGPRTLTPPVLSHATVPEDWRVILIFDHHAEGLSGAAERDAFGALAPLGKHAAAELCHLTLMGMLPALQEGDFDQFSRHVGAIQVIIGDHFAAAQAGRYTSKAVARAIQFCLDDCALAGVGQSSWGPTAFAFVPNSDVATQVVKRLEQRFGGLRELSFQVCASRNRGADIERLHDRRERWLVSG